MSSNSTSPAATESNISNTACDDRTCSNAKCALCLHCSQQYCFVHFLKHNEQLSLNAYNFTLAIDQLEDQMKSLKLDEHLRRTIHSLDQWRKNFIRTIDYIYQEKLSSIKANYIQLSNYLQQFQLQQSSHIQALRIDLEQMKFIRSTYVEEMEKIQMTIKQLQKNLSELEYGLQLKEHPIANIHDTVECEMIWKRQRTDEVQRSTTVEINDDDTGVNQDEEDIHDYSTNSTSTSSPTSYEHSLLSFLVANDSLPSTINKDDKPTLIEREKTLSTKKPSVIKKTSSNETSTNSNKKKRRCCINCGKCYHPSSLQRHYRQCKHSSSGETTLKTVTNTLNQSKI